MNQLNPTLTNPTNTPSPPLEIACSPQFPDWLRQLQLSLAFTTYQTNRLFLIGTKPDGGLSLFERIYDRAMGLYATPERLYISTRYQLWQLDNILAAGTEHDGYDKLYVPRLAHTTGDNNTHEVVLTNPPQPPTEKGQQRGGIVFVNTLFSCLAAPHPKHSFTPLWKPLFISKLVPEDKCHLNGLALENGLPAYVTACSTTDTAAGWRAHRHSGGAVIDVRTNEIVCTGLSMPHSPRVYGGKLWLLNSGTGEFGFADKEKGQFQPVVFCPGFVRGLAFHRNYAIIGMSQPRHQNFAGLALDERLATYKMGARCGLTVVDLTSGKVVGWLEFKNTVKELFDVAVLRGVRRPMALGFQGDEIERFVTFEGSSGIVFTRPTVGGQRGVTPPPSPLPAGGEGGSVRGGDAGDGPLTPSPPAQGERGKTPPYLAGPGRPGGALVKYQMVYHLSAENSIEYDALTFPSLKKRWQKQKQRGEILAVSASVAETLVGFVFAEILAEYKTAEIISLFVAPECRHQGIGTNLVRYLEKGLAEQGCRQVVLSYQVTSITAQALEPLLKKLNWQPPQTTFLLAKSRTDIIGKAPWLHKYPLPAAFTVFPWGELTPDERQEILQGQWYPPSLSPFGDEARIEPVNSLGLRYNGGLIGWCVNHRVAADTIRYSTLFVRERFQKLGRGASLLAESIKLQVASPIPYCTFSTAVDNAPMLKFVERYLKPYNDISESRRSVKRLRE
ncbi:MAG: TIGR03032 family protein [Oscillatoria princeps RMCB-10]|nr:TIGR03032 family protein [Oscillatoria princeps RMCB-10]